MPILIGWMMDEKKSEAMAIRVGRQFQVQFYDIHNINAFNKLLVERLYKIFHIFWHLHKF